MANRLYISGGLADVFTDDGDRLGGFTEAEACRMLLTYAKLVDALESLLTRLDPEQEHWMRGEIEAGRAALAEAEGRSCTS